MSSPSADGASPAARRLDPKLLLMAAGAALLLLTAAAALAVWLWPKAPDPAAKAARLAARRAAVSASAPASFVASAAASAAVSAPASAPASAPTSAPVSAVETAAADSAAPAAVVATAAALPDEALPAPAAMRVAATEAPLDRLQRRLAEVLGARGEIDPARPGELRLLTRRAPVVPISHAVEPTRPVGRAAAGAARGRTAAAEPARPWSYDGIAGPQAWGKLEPEFSQCAAGQRQSPIDIRSGPALDLAPVGFDYRAGGFSVMDDGHTVQVKVAPGSAIEIDGRRYALQQFHFHRPSEERVDGRRFEMGVHLVHQDEAGRLAVVAVLLERGAAQPLLQTVWQHLPLDKHEEIAARGPLDPAQLLPEDRRYYSYIGSLTTPPCSEGVLWLVMQQPVAVSAQQIDVFARLYPMNARPLQPAAGRVIQRSN